MLNIDHYKEILSVMPRNNIKNSKDFVRKALVIKQETLGEKTRVINELKDRCTSFLNVSKNPIIDDLDTGINKMKGYLYLVNKFNTSYEKSGLDRVLCDIRKFYTNDLTILNKNILKACDIFKESGIVLNANDFNYGKFVNSYITTLFNERGNLDSDVLKDSFDDIYWKCPDIVNYIYVNFRYLYNKNKDKFDKYFSSTVSSLNIGNSDNYLKEYKAKLNDYYNVYNKDIKLILDRFLNGELDPKEYASDKIEKIQSTLVVEPLDDEKKVSDFYGVIYKLSCTLKEYRNYLKYKYVINEIKEIYAQKEANKAISKPILKDIEKKEAIIAKANKKIDFKKKYFGKGSIDKCYAIIDATLVELKDLYKNYDEALFKENVTNLLNDNSTLYDILKFVLSYKLDLYKIIEKNNEDISVDDIYKTMDDISTFIDYPYNNIINNVTIKDDRDITLLIIDKYKIMNISINNETIDEANLDSFISSIEKVLLYSFIKEAGFDSNNINFVNEAKKVLDKNGISL